MRLSDPNTPKIERDGDGVRVRGAPSFSYRDISD